jgi:adrenodoxin-NADP+ reductase
VKNVINTFTKTAQNPNFNFYGNLSLGKDISLTTLRELYDVVILAYGTDIDSQLGIPGEDSKNVISAREFVAWYNGLPSYENLTPDLSGDVAIIIGQGNVAVDVARILLSPLGKLRTTDITEYTIESLSRSKIKEVYMVGRRGPCQAAFTIAELREMLKLPNVSTIWRAEDFKDIPQVLDKLSRPKKRIAELMLKSLNENSQNHERKFYPVFFRSPLKINGNSHVSSVDFCINDLIDNQSVPTDRHENIAGQLVCRSIGYKSISVDNSINFDTKKGRVNNSNGRVLKSGTDEVDNGLYVAGWLGTGPSGVILTTMNNGFSIAQTIIDDFKEGKIKAGNGQGLDPRKYNAVMWNDWLKIDKVEMEKGKGLNKPREKIHSIEEMLNIVS